ncbi:MAG: hypothetical protein QOD06_1835 [Candidatus Binatota bacterium]|jgi:hypothetical protein|nr:hypothetical protein [Candidatus Binatota bacterium]
MVLASSDRAQPTRRRPGRARRRARGRKMVLAGSDRALGLIDNESHFQHESVLTGAVVTPP